MTEPRYAELQMTSHFSFLRGASSCDELFAQAAAMGISALGIVDRNSLAGIVRAYEAARTTTGVRLIVGCRLDLADGMSVLVYPTDRPAYARLCRLLSLGKKRAGKGKCHLEWRDVVAYGEDLLVVLVPDGADETCSLHLRRLRDAPGRRGDADPQRPTLLIYYLQEGTKRFSDLRSDNPTISHKMLTLELRKLEDAGIVRRTEFAAIRCASNTI